jgi:hypothetical protein
LATALLGPDMAKRADDPFVAVQDEISHVITPIRVPRRAVTTARALVAAAPSDDDEEPPLEEAEPLVAAVQSTRDVPRKKWCQRCRKPGHVAAQCPAAKPTVPPAATPTAPAPTGARPPPVAGIPSTK